MKEALTASPLARLGALLALSIELPDNARTMAYLLAWLTGVVVAFRFGESVFGAVFRRH